MAAADCTWRGLQGMCNSGVNLTIVALAIHIHNSQHVAIAMYRLSHGK